MKNYSKDILYHELINNHNWNDFYNLEDPNLVWDYLYKTYLTAIDSIAPITILNNCKAKKSWVTPELLALIRERDEHKSKSDSLNSNWHFKEFKKCRNKVRKLLYTAKHEYITTRLWLKPTLAQGITGMN